MTTSNTKIDPKFYYECYVHMEKFDFSDPTISLKGCRIKKPNERMLTARVSGKLKEPSKQIPKLENKIATSPKKLPKGKAVKFIPKKQNSVSIQRCHTNNELAPKTKQDDSKDFKVSIQRCHTNNELAPKTKQDDSKDFKDPRKVLRIRRNIDYRERRSIGTPDKSLVSDKNNKIPIYKKEYNDLPKSRKRKGDLYDFIPESDDDKDSDISFIMPIKKKKVENRLKRPNKNIVSEKNRAGNKFTNCNMYDKKINGIMQKFSSQIKKKTHGCYGEADLLKAKEIKPIKRYNNNNELMKHSVFNSTMCSPAQKIILLDESIITNELNKNNLKELNITRAAGIPASENSSFNTEPENDSNLSFPPPLENLSIRNPVEEINNLFGFNEEIEESQKKNNDNGIYIIQNVLLKQSLPLNSQMSTLKKFNDSNSWRFDSDILSRNPHFVITKNNSLPSLNQEAILNSTFDEHIDEVNKVVLPSAKKSPRQQSILNFVETTKVHSDKLNYSQSLYDIDELSPLKNKKHIGKENLTSVNTINSETTRAKRNILGEISPNKDQVPNKSNPSNSANKELEQSGCFGFNSGLETIEYEPVQESIAKPFRAEITYKNRKKDHGFLANIERPVRDSEVKRLVEDDPGFEKMVDEGGLDCGDLRLFEDILESPKLEKISKPHTKKKTHQENKKKPAKEKLSKEALKWIKQFNEMCDEVEHEQLEVE